MQQLGVVYVAFGLPYLAMALTSVLSLRCYNPTVPVCVLTNFSEEPPPLAWFNTEPKNHWKYMNEPTSLNRLIKTDVYKHSPYYNTLYVDCDTLIVSDIGILNFYLDHFDILMKFVTNPTRHDSKVFNGTKRMNELGHFNSGVIAFKKTTNVERFFECWSRRYRELGYKRDQPSLLEAIYYSDVRLLPLPLRWNRDDMWYSAKSMRNDLIVWHYKVRMDRHLEQCLLRLTQSLSRDPRDLEKIKAFIQDRRGRRGSGTPKWMVKSLITTLRGPISKLPQQRVGKESWKRLLDLAT